MSENIWTQLPQPFFILAPMEDVTDTVFRQVIQKAARPDLFFTEFTNADSYCHPEGEKSVRGRLLFEQKEQPLIAHIWGDQPLHFEKMGKGLYEKGFKGIDINMGCPAPNVVKQGRGSGLIKRPEVAKELIAAAKKSQLPVSVKTRLGFSSTDERTQWVTHLLQQNIANLTVHLRTTEELSKVPAHYEYIDELVDLKNSIAPQTKLTINGDILDYQSGLQLAKQHQLDGIMIGRGIFKNPFAFEKEEKHHSTQEYLALLRDHLSLYEHYAAMISRPMAGLQRFFKIYIKEFKGASALRQACMQAKTIKEVNEILNTFEQQYF